MLQVLVSIYFIYVYIEKEFHMNEFIHFIRSIVMDKTQLQKTKRQQTYRRKSNMNFSKTALLRKQNEINKEKKTK